MKDDFFDGYGPCLGCGELMDVCVGARFGVCCGSCEHKFEGLSEKTFNLTAEDGTIPYAYARICKWPEPLGWVLTDVVVNHRHQGKGYGSHLMRLATEWADRHQVELTVLPAPVGGWMDYDEIVAWYERWGFTWNNELLKRTFRYSHHTQATQA